MTPADFIAAWRDNPLSERAGAQPFFLDLCELLGVGKPNDPEHYCFERGAMRTGAGARSPSRRGIRSTCSTGPRSTAIPSATR